MAKIAICPKCNQEMFEIYGEDDSTGLRCLCGYYFWKDEQYKKKG